MKWNTMSNLVPRQLGSMDISDTAEMGGYFSIKIIWMCDLEHVNGHEYIYSTYLLKNGIVGILQPCKSLTIPCRVCPPLMRRWPDVCWGTRSTMSVREVLMRRTSIGEDYLSTISSAASSHPRDEVQTRHLGQTETRIWWHKTAPTHQKARDI